MTCGRYEGSLDYETEDADSFASWDVDYLKYDNCYHRGRFGYPEASFNRFNVMAKALNATKRPILYSLCNWGEDYVHTWGTSIANSWRVSGDIYNSFNRPDDLCTCVDASTPLCIAPGSHCSVINIINRVAPYVDRSQHGGWNDLDMLEVGHGGMSDDEYVAHFSMWAALNSPLLIGADLRELPASALSILNKPTVIAVNQDPQGKSAHRVSRNLNVPKDKYGQGETQVWSGPLHGGDQVVVFLDAANEEMEMSVSLEDVFVSDGPGGSAPQVQETWHLYDLWANRMPTSAADRIVKAETSALPGEFSKVNWYNSTAVPYAQGLAFGDERLLGKEVGKVDAGSEIKATVPRHAVKMYRLRAPGSATKRYSIYKSEL
jgi:alpha-galactosidase